MYHEKNCLTMINIDSQNLFRKFKKNSSKFFEVGKKNYKSKILKFFLKNTFLHVSYNFDHFEP